MLNKEICECTNSSFFLIDKNYRLSSFNIESMDELGFMLEKKPTIGELIGEIIAHRYKENFLLLLAKCFDGIGFSTQQRFATLKADDLVMQIIFTPITIEGRVDLVNCAVINNEERTSVLKMLRAYSQLTSHELRAPIATILGLSTIYNGLETYDVLKISDLLSDINSQAIKLDEVISALNGMIYQQVQQLSDKG